MWSKQFYHYIVADWLKGDRDVAEVEALLRAGEAKEVSLVDA